MTERCKVLEASNEGVAKEELLSCSGPRTVIMPHSPNVMEVWTGSIKLAAKFMEMPERYQHLETERISGIAIHKFHTLDPAEKTKEIACKVPSEVVKLNPIHHEILLH